jgi:phage tail sheath protein FI
MPLQTSPGISVSERDLTTVIPSVSTSEGGIVGMFRWGPLNTRVLVSDETDLVDRFFKPNSNTATDFFTATNFLNYANALYVVRVATEASAKNAAANTGGATVIKNDDDYDDNFINGVSNAGAWVAKYPGVIGNSLKVSVCPAGPAANSYAFERTLTGVVAATVGSATISGSSTLFGAEVVAGDDIVIGNEVSRVAGVTNATSLTVSTTRKTAATAATAKKRWQYFSFFENQPKTSYTATDVGATYDQIHVAVVDEDGIISGTQGTVLETYPNLSLAPNALTEDGSSAYYKTVINNKSKWIRWGNAVGVSANVGVSAVSGVVYNRTSNNAINSSLAGGLDGGAPTSGDLQRGYDKFRDKDEVDVSFLLAAGAGSGDINYLATVVAGERKDCLVTFSPSRASVVDNEGSEVTDIIDFRNTVNLNSSYAVMDSGWKKQYDKYNDVYRWVPLNGDIAGTMAYTDSVRDPWFSPAGFARGQIKNVVKLAYNPSRKADRDLLYKQGVNPVVTFPGQGTVLYGDRTQLSAPSAFDRINVRRLFIVLQKAISRAAQAQLFEINNEFTRAQFVNLVEPYLRDVQGREGIYDFTVISDSSNNPDAVIDNNEFVGDIYVKPARSTNYIQLNFIAVRTGVDFNEIIGQI